MPESDQLDQTYWVPVPPLTGEVAASVWVLPTAHVKVYGVVMGLLSTLMKPVPVAGEDVMVMDEGGMAKKVAMQPLQAVPIDPVVPLLAVPVVLTIFSKYANEEWMYLVPSKRVKPLVGVDWEAS